MEDTLKIEFNQLVFKNLYTENNAFWAKFDQKT